MSPRPWLFATLSAVALLSAGTALLNPGVERYVVAARVTAPSELAGVAQQDLARILREFPPVESATPPVDSQSLSVQPLLDPAGGQDRVALNVRLSGFEENGAKLFLNQLLLRYAAEQDPRRRASSLLDELAAWERQAGEHKRKELEARSERERLESVLAAQSAKQEEIAKGGDAEAGSAIDAEILSLKAQRARLLAHRTERHPKVQEISREIERLEEERNLASAERGALPSLASSAAARKEGSDPAMAQIASWRAAEEAARSAAAEATRAITELEGRIDANRAEAGAIVASAAQTAERVSGAFPWGRLGALALASCLVGGIVYLAARRSGTQGVLETREQTARILRLPVKRLSGRRVAA